MLELYHNALSSCSQKVRIVLGEKGLDWKSHDIDLQGGQHDPEYVTLNPNHVVPTLVHDGRVLIESTLINEYLDDAFPETPLRPADPPTVTPCGSSSRRSTRRSTRRRA